MEITLDTLINIATLLLGSGSGAFFTWKWISRKSKAEAQEAEVDMAQKVQDTYQQMLTDKQTEVDDKNRIITELRQDRDHFREDRNEMRERLDKTERKIHELEDRVARNGRQMAGMSPFLCTRHRCKERLTALVTTDGEIKTTKKQQDNKEDENESK